MVAWEKLTQWVIGRALSDKSEQKKLEREYKDVAEALKAMTEVMNEPRIEFPSRPPSVYTTSLPQPRVRRDDSLLTAGRPAYERCISSPAITTFASSSPLTGPPCITARDLSAEDLKRNYSCDSVWNFDAQPLPPMPQMTGFGRYRRATNAPAQWQLERVNLSLRDMGGVVVGHLGDCPPAGLEPEVWRDYKAQHSRASSFASSGSSGSGLGRTVATEYVDPNTGTLVTRGFCASTTSSAASSFKNGSTLVRRDSNLSKTSMTSPSSDGDARHSRRPGRMPLHRHHSAASMSPLTAISEAQEAFAHAPRKIARPCVFDQGSNNEDALASDEEEDECDWGDILEIGDIVNPSNLTRRLARGERTSSSRGPATEMPPLTRQRTTSSDKQRSRAWKKTVPDRSKTIKATTRANQVRFQGQRKYADSDKTAGQEGTVPTIQKTMNRPDDMEQTSEEMNLNIIVVGGDIPQSNTGEQLDTQQYSAGEGIKCTRDMSATPSPEQTVFDTKASLQSDTSKETLFAGGATKENIEPFRNKRQRSSTICRATSTGSPCRFTPTPVRETIME